jgi:hypothetical protein
MRENLDEARVQSIWWAGGEHRDTYLFSLQPNPISEEPLPAHAELFRDQQPTAAVEKIAGSALNSTRPCRSQDPTSHGLKRVFGIHGKVRWREAGS